MSDTAKKVLIVDDDKQASDNVRNLVKSVGIQCIMASDGYQGLDLLSQNKGLIPVVLLDLMMPGIDGLEFLKAVKVNPEKYGKTSLIIFTNMTSNAVVKEAFDLGACTYLLKSNIDPDGLVKEICKYFDD
jgi:CheY-like chemotaxis protein